jgi:Ser/Thr protein kinase RdoA (MazF antagonist)
MSAKRDAAEDLKVVDAYWPALTDEELAWLFSGLPELGAYVKRLTVSARPLTAASRVLTTQGEVFVKRHARRVREPNVLEREHELVNALAGQGFPTPRVLARAEQGEFVYEVQQTARGEDRYGACHTWTPFRSEAEARSAGRTLRRLHDIGEELRFERRLFGPQVAQCRLLEAGDLTTALGDLGRRPELADLPMGEAVAAYAPFHAGLGPRLAELPQALTHGDWQNNNLFWDGDEVASVIDFHLLDRNPRLFDVAVALDRNCIEWLKILGGEESAWHEGLMRAFLAGYGPLTDPERSALPDLLAAVRLDFALSLLLYYRSVEGNEARAAWCWEVFVLGHARWHASDEGAKLRVALERAA